ncbi:hypothetical protein PPL_10646 [Heterostelium album PN500]|uniref:Uncharacterized protein n=1 Tax=Heterostelium pallidum (strain ATCC 26659 / Pp 5 / PN500) TaxID=670386 RepID=D3BRN5_HETP5|nr:hypothetical protein PPL_10646 [Heterostelium album PN500]EFA76067.1 hypothetical protein PPL_10646 [Heterostelium album PN500]|eukprot:XP_020428201.1 hypothetical protein PPL_10646 [Heterostelium album PN500]
MVFFYHKNCKLNKIDMSTVAKNNNTSAAAGGAPKKDRAPKKENNRENNKTTTTTSTGGVAAGGNKQSNGGEKKDYPVDPKLVAFENRINEMFEQRTTLIKKKEEIIKSLKDKRQAVKTLYDASGSKSSEKKELQDKKSEMLKQRTEMINTLKKMIEEQKVRRDGVDAQSKDLPFRINARTTLEDAILSIEKAAQEIEKEIEAERNPNVQRNLIKKQSGFNAQRRSITEFFATRETIAQFDTAITNHKSKIDPLTKEIDDLEAKIKEIKDTASPNSDKIKILKDEINSMDAKVKELQVQIDAVQPKIDAEKIARTTYKEEAKKLRKEQQEKKRAEYLENERKRTEERQKREEEQRQEELRKVPYEQEMYKCDNLVTYLESLKPKTVAEKVTATQAVNTADLDGMVALAPKTQKSRGGAKDDKKKKDAAPKPLPEVIRHPMSVFSDFELISMAPPSKYADIDESIVQLRSKKEHYKTLSAQVMEQRQKAQQEAAEAKPTTTTTTTTAATEESTTTTTAAATESKSETTTADSSETTPAATPDTNGQVEVEAQ